MANDNDSFLEYFLKVPCDYHEQPTERTYQLLKDAGWYEERKIDITEIVDYCRKKALNLPRHRKISFPNYCSRKKSK